jgi:hypothetical protein
MAVFRIYLADGDRRVKADLWRIVEIQQLSNQQPELRLKLTVS